MIDPELSVDRARRTTDDDNPWPGLEAFREGDAAVFYGRENPTADLVQAVVQQRLVVLYGRSGLGKTSLLRAGVFPKLRDAMLLPVYVRVDFRTLRTASDVTLLRSQVKTSIEAAAAEANVTTPAMDPGLTLWEWFYSTDGRYCDERSQVVLPVLVFDQCEEAFTHGREDGRSPVTSQFMNEIVDLIRGSIPASVSARLKQQPALALKFSRDRDVCHVVLSLRKEFLSDLLTYRPRLPTLLDHRLELKGMTPEEARCVVTGPGRDLVEPGVEAEIVQAVTAARRSEVDQVGDDAMIDPAILSVFCRELNRRRQVAGLPKITATLVETKHETIIAEFYAQSVEDLGPDVERFIEEELITRSGNRGSVAVDDALDKPGVTQTTIDTLVERRLLRREGSGRGQRLELTHDVLTDPIMARRNARRERERQNEERLKADAIRKEQEEAAERRRREQELIIARREAASNAELLDTKRRANIVQRWFIAGMVGLLAVAGVMFWGSQTAEREARTHLATARIEQAIGLIAAGRRDQGFAYVAEALGADPDSIAARSLAIDAILHTNWPLPIAKLTHENRVLWAEFTPDSSRVVTVSEDQTARIWSVPEGKEVGGPLKHNGAVLLARFTADGSRLLTIATDGLARLWDVSTGQQLEKYEHPGAKVTWATIAPPAAAATPGTLVIATGADDGTVRVWGGAAEIQWNAYLYPLNGAQFSPDGASLLTRSRERTREERDALTEAQVALLQQQKRDDEVNRVRVWNWRARKMIATLEHDDDVTGAQFSADSMHIATSSRDGKARIWTADRGQTLRTLSHPSAVLSVQFSPDGTQLLTACDDKMARLWDTSSGQLLGTPMPHSEGIVSASFAALGQRVVTASSDQTARIWDVPYGRPLGEPMRHSTPLQSAVMSRDMQYAVTTTDEGTAYIWDIRLGSALPASLWLLSRPMTVGFSANGQGVIYAEDDGSWMSWDGAGGEPKSVTTVANPNARVAAVSRDGRRIVTGTREGAAQVWSLDDGAKLGASTQTGEIQSVEFSSDGSLILSRTGDGSARTWDARSGQSIHDIPGPLLAVRLSRDAPLVLKLAGDQVLRQATLTELTTGRTVATISQDAPITEGAFSPDGQAVVTLSTDGKARLWQVASGQPIETITDEGGIVTVEFSADGRRLATGAGAGSIRIWDVSTGQPHTAALQSYAAASAPIEIVRFTPDGQRVLSVSRYGTIRVWDVPTGEDADAGRLRSLVETLTGYQFNDSGAPSQVSDRLRRIETERAAFRAAAHQRLANRLGAWALDSRTRRAISPFTSMTIDQFAEQQQKVGLDGLREAREWFPWHPSFKSSVY